MITVDQFKAFWSPKFASVDEAVIQAQLTAADEHFDEARWGGYFLEGVCNYVAHVMLVNRADDDDVLEANDVTARNTETIQISRDATLLQGQVRDPHRRTTYGQRYLYLSRLVGTGAVVTPGVVC